MPGRSYVAKGEDGVRDEDRNSGLGGEIGGEIEPVAGRWGAVESGGLRADEDGVERRDEDGAMRAPGGARAEGGGG